MSATVGGRLSLPANQNRISDEDIGSMQRLSFVSSSTGYSSARSSVRSSEIGEDSFLSKTSDFAIERRIIPRETLLSEARRVKLVKRSNLSQLDCIAMELLETERCYVNDLSDIIQGYLNFFIGHREHFGMTVDDVSNTFGCIERIYLFNKRLFYQLDRALLNVVQVVIFGVIPVLNRFLFCRMVDTLSVLMKNNNVVEGLSARQSLLGHSLPLSAYLLKPVQRVLKYHLFMENILKQTSETRSLSDSNLATIKKALQSLTSLADKINEEKKRVEHFERVRELQSALHSWSLDKRNDLFKYGDLVLEGTFKLAGSKTNRQLFLFEEMLLIVKERSGTLICKDYIMCSSIMLNESTGADVLAFQVMSYDNPKLQYIFIASNLEQKREWMKELKRMMLDHYDVKIPERTKLLMLNADNVVSKETATSHSSAHGGTKSQKLSRKVPKYLEKKRKLRESDLVKRNMQKRESLASLKNNSSVSLRDDMVECSQTEVNCVRENLTCTCSYSAPQQNFGNNPKECRPNLQYIDESCETSASFFANLFAKKKPEATSTKDSVPERKNGTSRFSSMLHHSSPAESFGYDSTKSDTMPLRCTCHTMNPTVSPISHTADLSENHFLKKSVDSRLPGRNRRVDTERSINSKQRADKPFEKKGTKSGRLSLFERTGLINRNEGKVESDETGKRHSLDTHRCRSKSLSRLDEAYCSSTFSDALFTPLDHSQEYTFNSIEGDSDVFINSSAFGKYLDEVAQERIQESEREEEEEEEEIASLKILPESPAVRDRANARKNFKQMSSHRRRCSQVAELVWRLRQKQDLQKKMNNDNVDETLICVPKSNSCSTEKTQIPEEDKNDCMTTKVDNISLKNAPLPSARQRTPLTTEQQAQLDEFLLEPQLGVVKEMIKQLESQPRAPFRVL